jgi:hypothetical protein
MKEEKLPPSFFPYKTSVVIADLGQQYSSTTLRGMQSIFP